MPTPGPHVGHPHRDAFVGRAGELTDLESDLGRLPHPRGPVRILRGVAGVGKTRLAEELSRRARDAGLTVVWARSAEDVGAPAYWHWTQVLRTLTGRPGTVELAELVLAEPGPIQRFELFDATAGVLRSSTPTGGLLVVLDDLHTADPATMQLTRFLARQLWDEPILVVATVRSGDGEADTAEQVDALARLGLVHDLTGIDVAAVGELLGDDAHAESVHAVTAGNPLYVHEAARWIEAVTAEGVLDASRALDESLRSVLAARLRRIDGDARRLLDAAAVLGFEIDRRELVALAEPWDPLAVDGVLAHLDDEGFLVDADPVRFGHPMVAQVLREEMTDRRRHHLHLTAARMIGADGRRSREVAHHLVRAGRGWESAAIDACRRAADAATTAAAHEVAVSVLEEAATLVDADDDLAQRLDVLVDLGAALWRAGRPSEADAAYERAWDVAEELGDADSMARAVLRNGVDYYFADDVRDEIAPRVRRALDAQTSGEGAVRARLLAELATHHLVRDPGHGVDLARQAVEMARRSGDPVALGNALIARQVTDLGPRTLTRRIADAHEILACARDSGDYRLVVHGRFLLMGALLEAGDIGGVDEELAVYDGFTDDLGEPRYERFSMWLRTTRAMLDGDLATADELAAASLKISESLEDPDAVSVYGGQLGVLSWMRGRVQDMEPLYTDLRSAQPDEPLWPSVLAWIAATHGETDAARGALDAVSDLSAVPSGMHWLLTATTYAEAAAIVGSDAQVDTAWNALVPYADRVVPIAMGAAVWGTVAKPLGHLALRRGRVDEGVGYLRMAVRTCARLGARPWLVEAQLDLADALEEHRHDDAEVRSLRTQARSVAARLGLDMFLRRVDASPTAVADRDPTPVPSPTPARRRPTVRVIGGFEVIDTNGDAARWTSRKARQTLKILVSRRGVPINREVLMDLLWPDEDPETLGNRMSVALSTVRRTLDPARIHGRDELVSSGSDSVVLGLEVVDVDVEHLLGDARRVAAYGDVAVDEDTAAQAARLLDRHRGDALPDEPHADWATPVRDEVRAAMIRLGRIVAAHAETVGDHARAVDAHRRVLDLDPYDVPAHRGAVAAFAAMGAHGQAAAAFETYRARMAELGVVVTDGD